VSRAGLGAVAGETVVALHAARATPRAVRLAPVPGDVVPVVAVLARIGAAVAAGAAVSVVPGLPAGVVADVVVRVGLRVHVPRAVPVVRSGVEGVAIVALEVVHEMAAARAGGGQQRDGDPPATA
jgi:hypothetical protein